jgi:hypothetical protein
LFPVKKEKDGREKLTLARQPLSYMPAWIQHHDTEKPAILECMSLFRSEWPHTELLLECACYIIQILLSMLGLVWNRKHVFCREHNSGITTHEIIMSGFIHYEY